MRAIIMAAAMALMGGAAWADPRQDFDKAEKAYQAHDYRTAAQGFGVYIQQMPSDANGYVARGDSYYMMKDYAPAIVDYQQALRLEPTAARQVSLANALDDAGRFDEAVAAYRGAIALDPNYAASYKELGVAQNRRKDYAGAAQSYAKLAELKPSDAQAQYLYGGALLDSGRPVDAVAPLQRSATLKPDDGNTLRRLGDALAASARYDEAIASFDRALAINANDFDVLISKGNVFYNRKDYAGSIPFYLRAKLADPKRPMGPSYLGDAYYQTGQYNLAKEQFIAAVNLESGFLQAHEGLARTLAALNDKTGAEAEIDAVRRIDGERADALQKKLYP